MLALLIFASTAYSGLPPWSGRLPRLRQARAEPPC